MPKSRQGGDPPRKGEPGEPPKTSRSSSVGNVKNNDPSLIEPIAGAGLGTPDRMAQRKP